MRTFDLELGLANFIPVIFEGRVLGLVENQNSVYFTDCLRRVLKNPERKDQAFNQISIGLF